MRSSELRTAAYEIEVSGGVRRDSPLVDGAAAPRRGMRELTSCIRAVNPVFQNRIVNGAVACAQTTPSGVFIDAIAVASL